MAIVDETVLRRPIGGIEVMRGQLRHLVRQAALPSVCLQIVPVSIGAHQGLNGPFTVLDFADPSEPTVAYLEYVVNGAHVQKETEVHEYKLAFDRLRSVALSPRDSVAFIELLIDDL